MESLELGVVQLFSFVMRAYGLTCFRDYERENPPACGHPLLKGGKDGRDL